MMIKKSGKKKLVLLDSHAIIHRAYHALPDFTSSKGEPTGALYGVSLMLLKIIDEFNPDYIVAAYDLPKPTFRHEVYKEYKAGRRKADDELVSQIIRSRDIFKHFGIPIYEKEGFEADDVIGTIAAELAKKKDMQTIIASGDMDTLQLVDGEKVVVYTLKKGIQNTIIYDEKAVKERFGFGPELLPDYKGLRGDPSDNIIGIKGIGEVAATKLITNFGTIEEIYKTLKKNREAVLKTGLKERVVKLLEDGEEEALFSKVLAQIRLDVPINFEIPKKTFLDALDVSYVKELFAEFGFRSLSARLNTMFPDQMEAEIEKEEGKVIEKEKISENELEHISIGAWLLDSNITNPQLDDILDISGRKTFKEAKTYILAQLKKDGLVKVYTDIELPLIPILKEVTRYGVRVDKKYLKELSKEYHKILHGYETQIYKLAGEEFNINSPKQLSVILYDTLGIGGAKIKKTQGGARSTRASELEKLKEDNPIVEKVLAYREFQKLLSTYIDNIPDMLDKDDRLHAQFIQTGAATGRFSSQNPNLQNIPIRTEHGKRIRKAFIASIGYTLVSLDYSQVELRVAALLSKDKKLIEIFKEGKDVHTATATEIFGKDFDKSNNEMRRVAKIINFGVLFGMGVNSLRKNIGGTRKEAQEFYERYFEAFSGVAKYIEKVKKEVHRDGYTKTLYGRRRYFPNINSSLPFLRAQEERMAVNAPIQGTAADIIKIAMIAIEKRLVDENLSQYSHLLMQIHDELVYETKDSKVKEISKILKEEMEGVVKGEIPFTVEIKKGKNWEF